MSNKDFNINDILNLGDLKNLRPEQLNQIKEVVSKMDKETIEKLMSQIPSLVENNKELINGIMGAVNSKDLDSDPQKMCNDMIKMAKDMFGKNK